jgi:hypothetical protein
MLAIALVVLAFNVLVVVGSPTLIAVVMDTVSDLQMFRGIGLMAVGTDQPEVAAFYNQLALLTLDFSYERAQCPTARQYRWIAPWIVLSDSLSNFPKSMSAALLVGSRGAMVSPLTSPP